MKKLALILLVLNFGSNAIAQGKAIAEAKLTTIPEQGVLLNNGWRFHAGDDTAWINPDFDDSNWETVNPARDIRDIPQIQHISNYWFRLKLDLDTQLTTRSLGLLLSQVGASEIYLNGKLLYKLGEVSTENINSRTHFLRRRPFAFQMDAKTRQVFAVRYAYKPNSFLIKYANPNYCFYATLNTSANTVDFFKRELRRSTICEISCMCLWLVLSFISLSLFLLYPSQRAYLHIAGYGFLVFLWSFCGHFSQYIDTTEGVSTALAVSVLFGMSSNFIAFYELYRLFNQKRSWFFNVLIAYASLSYLALFFSYKLGDQLIFIYFIAVNIEGLRICLKAYRARKSGAAIILTAIVIYFISIFLALTAVSYNNVGASFIITSIGVCLVAFGWGLFIASEFARTGIALQKRMHEVEQLHKRTVEQEQEKQQLLSRQNEKLESEVQHRTFELNKSLRELKSAQAQLVQSEKMASLGELTAGIAHEIQNPLNFVNNFSEINSELINELKNEKSDPGNYLEKSAGQEELLNNILQNNEKITLHGKRADAIVKSMLLHAGSGSAKKEITDINALAEEHLRMAYQGFRAKDKSFLAVLKTDFDTAIDELNIVPQDLGRVFLNLYTNALHSIKDKQKMAKADYEPVVSVTTKRIGHLIEIRVSDNGVGVSEKVLDKIFQPFFTTRPTGQGTGLGLSLSYDIIKSLGGEIAVESKENEGAVFILKLPVA